MASGTNIELPDPDTSSSFTTVNGTSISTPIVAGIAVLIMQAYYEIYDEYPTASNVKSWIKYWADPGGQDTNPNDTTGGYSHSSTYGYGIVDIWEAIYDIISS